MIVGPFLVSSKKLTFFVFKKETCKCYWCRFLDAAHATTGSAIVQPVARMRPSRRCGSARQVFVVVKLSDNLSLLR